MLLVVGSLESIYCFELMISWLRPFHLFCRTYMQKCFQLVDSFLNSSAYESLFSIDPLLHALTIVYLKFNLQANYVYNYILFHVIKMRHVEIYIIHNMSSFYIFCSKIGKYIFFLCVLIFHCAVVTQETCRFLFDKLIHWI